MKKAFLIIAVVAAYSAIETVLLLSVIAPNPLVRFPDAVQIAVGWGQFLLIPGMAALISRIMYGPYVWPRRTLMIMLMGAGIVLVVPVGLLLFGLSAALLIWAYGVSRILFWVLLPLVVCAMLSTFVFLVRKSGKWTVQAEAERWLAERQSGVSQRDRAWRNRGIRIAVCIPSLIALAIFLFLPETWGLVTHLRWRHCGDLAGYKVNLPANWIVFYYQSEEPTGRSYVNGFIGRSIVRGGNPWRYGSASSWVFGTWGSGDTDRTDTVYNHWPPKPDDIVNRRTIRIGTAALVCVEYWPSHPWATERNRTTEHVSCSGVDRLHATYNGPPQDIDAFYRVLSGITETK